MARKNNCLLSSIFPAGEGGLGQMIYRSLERSPQDPREGIFLYSAQASFSWPRVDLARLLRRAYSRLACVADTLNLLYINKWFRRVRGPAATQANSRCVWIIFFEFVQVCGIRFCIWESFIDHSRIRHKHTRENMKVRLGWTNIKHGGQHLHFFARWP